MRDFPTIRVLRGRKIKSFDSGKMGDFINLLYEYLLKLRFSSPPSPEI